MSRGYYEIIDKCKNGASIREIRRNIKENFSELESDDFVVIGRSKKLCNYLKIW